MRKCGLFLVLLAISTTFYSLALATEVPKELGLSFIKANKYFSPFGVVVILDEGERSERIYAAKITICNPDNQKCTMVDWLHTGVPPTNKRLLESLNHRWEMFFPETKSHLEIKEQFPEPITDLKILMTFEAVPNN